MRRRISRSICQVGETKAFWLRNRTASVVGLRDEVEPCAGLADVLLLRVVTADYRGDVVHLQRPLAEHAPVEFAEVVVRFAGLSRGRWDEHFPTRLRFSWPIAVDLIASASPTASVNSPGSLPADRRSKSGTTGFVLFEGPGVQRGTFVVRGLRVGDRLVAPRGGPFVVRPEPGIRSSTAILSSGWAT